jgi:hypothetical protein
LSGGYDGTSTAQKPMTTRKETGMYALDDY